MVMNASTARMIRTTTNPLNSGSGSLNGIAAQLSLPSMSTSGLMVRRTRGTAGAPLSRTCHRLVEDALEQLRPHRAIGLGRHGFARLCQLGIGGIVEGGAGATHLL